MTPSGERVRPQAGAVRRRCGIIRVALSAIVASLALPACDRGGAPPAGGGFSNGGPPPPAPAAAWLRGHVRLAAGVPLPPPVAPPPPCGHPAEGRTPRDLSVDPETRGIADAIVSLVDPPRDVPPPASRRAVLDQASCEFSPRAQVVPVGSELLVRNSDPELHNIHARIAADRRELFNVGMAPGNPDLPILLRRPGLVEVRCDVHPWMGAAILVADHPFAAATDARGAFGFPAPPSGTYRVHAWHAKLGAVEKEIEIGISNEAAVEIEMPGPAPAKGG